MKLTVKAIESYRQWLIGRERSSGTISQYMREINDLFIFLPESRKITREQVQLWKAALVDRGLSPSTVNAALTAVNGFFRFMHWGRI